VLNVDPTKLPGRPAEWVALLHAVEHAADGDEQTWLEWKSSLNLTSKHDVGTILSKAILAMANRDPDDAAKAMTGHGIVIVGLEPGTVHGVTPVDNADLDKLVSLYVGGADGPRWQPHLYKHAGKDVLIVVVDPPRWGDPIWTMRKQIDKYADGTIFVRKRARSEPANSADIARLSERFARTEAAEGLNIDVGIECPQPLARIAWTAEGIESGIDAERAHLMRPLLNERNASALPMTRANLNVSGMPDMRAALRTARGLFPSEPEPRSEEQYEAAVETYLDAVRLAMPEALVNVGSGLVAAPRFVATNLTQRNYQRLEVSVHIAGDIWARRTRSWKPQLEESLPPRPRLWGPLRTSPVLNIPAIYPPHIPIGPRTTIEHDGSVTLTFVPIDLRPGKTEMLEAECILLVPDHRDEAVIAEWFATATNANGQATGHFEIPFDGQTVNLRTKREAADHDD
jgi:hypothetical protein